MYEWMLGRYVGVSVKNGWMDMDGFMKVLCCDRALDCVFRSSSTACMYGIVYKMMWGMIRCINTCKTKKIYLCSYGLYECNMYVCKYYVCMYVHWSVYLWRFGYQLFVRCCSYNDNWCMHRVSIIVCMYVYDVEWYRRKSGTRPPDGHTDARLGTYSGWLLIYAFISHLILALNVDSLVKQRRHLVHSRRLS